MPPSMLPFRQVHLDFHTSPHIAGVGSQFDPDRFADTLQRARVNSVTCFARCHHGYAYYDTKRFPHLRHPALTRDLLREQIQACHARGIRVPIYITVQWDHLTALQHPEWLVVNEFGAPAAPAWGKPPSFYQPGFYRFLCLNTPYVDFLKDFTAEVLETFDVDGLFFDIVQPMDCSCRFCRDGMTAAGLDPADPATRRTYGLNVLYGFKRDMTAFVRERSRDCTIFYNAGHVGPRHRAVLDAYTHLELESLPSGEWGYLHFPMTVRYARTLGLDCVGMTGKFHTSWGDFHSFKNPAALQFECFRSLALGARCSVGDQLHPLGALCDATYELIGSVYAEVEKKEPWCVGARPLADIAVLTPEEFASSSHSLGLPRSLMGAVRMLQESAHQFDVIDSARDFTSYKVLVLPDEIPVSPALAQKIDACLAAGGALIASHRSGLNPSGDAFALDALGVALKGDAPYSPDFIVPGPRIASGLKPIEHVMYLRALEVEAESGAEVLARVVVPYFNRTWEHFCSHRHTPSSGRAAYPAVVMNERAVYFAHPVFTQYQQCAPLWCKRLFLGALALVLPEPLVRADGPSTMLTTLSEQPGERRFVLHLLHYVPERRSDAVDVVEDVIPLRDVRLSLRLPSGVSGVMLVPEMTPLPFRARAGRIEFTVPEISGHRMLSLQLV